MPEIDNDLRHQANLIIGERRLPFASLATNIQEELDFDRAELTNYLNERIQGPRALTESQRIPFDEVMSAVRNGNAGAFFIDAPGGTGKSYVLNSILAAVRLMSEDSIALAVAASGIAATLLLLGRTFHSRFKAPLDLDETSSLNIPLQSDLAELIRRAKLIVWDEAPMNHRFLLEALDRSLRKITGIDLPFGGKPILLAGDFRQILPVVKKGSRAQTVDAVINRSLLWKQFRCFQLTENMRVLQHGSSEQLNQFIQWLLLLGEGNINPVENGSEFVLLKPENCIVINPENIESLKTSMKNLIAFVYPELQQNVANRRWLAGRAILAPLNIAVDEINEICLDLIHGHMIECFSADSTIEPDESTRFPTEHLNSLNLNGIPPHRLVMKIGAPLMLLRNINPKEGLCNGTRLILQSVNRQLLNCKIVGGHRDGENVLLPRITFTPNDNNDFPVDWKRRQYPVRTSFAMTIHKSQGQSLERVGVWLEEPVFSHGQLYVASSRVGNPENIQYAISPRHNYSTNATRNVVYREVFNNGMNVYFV